MSEQHGALAEALRASGLSDRPDLYDSSIHSWRCEHPDRYGPCDCFAELVTDLARLLADAERHVRAEYENAITWDTTCLNCAKLLDKSYGEWAAGHKAGFAEGAGQVAEAVEAVVRDYWGYVPESIRAALTPGPTNPAPQGDPR